MRVPTLGETELLVPLHDGMFEQPMWQTFLARLRSGTGAQAAALILQPPAKSGATRLVQGGEEWAARLAPLLSAIEQGKLRLREGRSYGLSDLDGDWDAGFSGLQLIRASEEGGLAATLLLANDKPLGADIASLLSALVPHLKTALRVLAGVERERARSEMSAEVFARINFGWISLDAKGRIVGQDPQAERLLQQSGALSRGHYDRLTPSDPAVDRQLTALLREFAANPRARPRAINLSHDPWIDILVAPLRLEALAGGSEAVAVVYIRGDRTSSADRAEQLVDLFDLTPSEARMAWSMAQGLSIAEAAEEHGLTIETARNYSKKIYAKTGARGQVDLVRHVLTGVLALA